jgi:purine nucleoside phosphorylase
VTNLAAGLQAKVSHEEVVGIMKEAGTRAKELVETTISRLSGGGTSR